MMRRGAIIWAVALAIAAVPAFGAEINLRSLERPSNWQTLAEQIEAIRLFQQLGLDDRQFAEMAQRLATIPTAEKEAAKQEAIALLEAKDALQKKWEALLDGKEPPKEVEQQVEEAMVKIAAARSTVERAKSEALAGIIATLSDDQKLMIRWESGGPDVAERRRLLAQARQEYQRLMNVIIGLLRPTMERLLYLRNQEQYLRLRGGIAQELLDALAGQRLIDPSSPQYQSYLWRLFEVFDVVRHMDPAEYERREPEVVQMLLRALGIRVGIAPPAEPIISETRFRELLLRDSTLELVQRRVQALRTRRPGPRP